MNILTANIAQMVKDSAKNIGIADKYKVAFDLSMGIFKFDLGSF